MRFLPVLGLGVVLVGALGMSAPAAAAPREPAGVVPCVIIFGKQISHVKIVSDPDGLARSIGMPRTITLTYRGGGCGTDRSIAVCGDEPWVDVGGDLDPKGPGFSAAGVGTVAGLPNVQVTFAGAKYVSRGHGTNRDGVGGLYTVGANGELGGKPVVYEVTRKPGRHSTTLFFDPWCIGGPLPVFP